MTQTALQVVLTTCPDQPTATRIARTLVEEHLAACANMIPSVRSVYRWKGQVEESTETLLVIKSTQAHFPAIVDRIRGLHPYELPEIIAVPIADGLPDYLSWIHHPD